MIASVHIPKTGGISLGNQFKTYYGKAFSRIVSLETFSLFHGVKLKSLACYRKASVIHGHFTPFLIPKGNDDILITFLREPIENRFSLYAFLQKRALPPYPTFKGFITIPSIRYLYTNIFFKNFNMDNMDFVGDFANYRNEITRLEQLLGISFGYYPMDNVTRDSDDCPPFYTDTMLCELKEDKEVVEILSSDIEFYHTHKGK